MDWGLPIIIVVLVIVAFYAARQINFRQLFRRKPAELSERQKDIQRHLMSKIVWGEELTPSEEIALESIREITDNLDEEAQFTQLVKGYKAQYRTESKSKFFPEQVPIISYEKNAEECRISFWNLVSANVVMDNDRGKAADLGKARPVSLVVFGKTMIAFQIDGDRGIGIKLLMSNTLIDISTTAEEAWAYLESGKLAKIFTDDLTARQRILLLLVGFIVGQVVFFLFKI